MIIIFKQINETIVYKNLVIVFYWTIIKQYTFVTMTQSKQSNFKRPLRITRHSI